MTKETIDKFIELCHKVYEAETDQSFKLLTAEARGYSNAIQVAFGLNAWGDMVMQTDLSFDKNVLVCAGVPLFRKELQPVENERD